MKSPTPGASGYLNGVTAVSSDEVWAVGGHADGQGPNAQRTLIERWDGSRWRVVVSPNKGPSESDLNGITSASGGVFAAGSWWRGYDGPLAPLVLERCA